MDSEKFKKFLMGLEWNDTPGMKTRDSFNSIMILFEDGEFILQPSDSIEPEELEKNNNVYRYTYLNEHNRTDLLHMSLIFVVFKETNKAKESFTLFNFAIKEFMDLFKTLDFKIKTDNDQITGVSYTVEIEINQSRSHIKFTEESVAHASCLILSLYYGTERNNQYFPNAN